VKALLTSLNKAMVDFSSLMKCLEHHSVVFNIGFLFQGLHPILLNLCFLFLQELIAERFFL